MALDFEEDYIKKQDLYDTIVQGIRCVDDLDLQSFFEMKWTPFEGYRQGAFGLFSRLSDPEFNPFYKLMMISWVNKTTLTSSPGIALAYDLRKTRGLLFIDNQIKLLVQERREFPDLIIIPV